MIEQIIADAKAMEAEAIRAEEDAQKAYEDFVKETNAFIEAKSKEIVNKSESKAKAEADLVEAKGFEEYKKNAASGGRSVKKTWALYTGLFATSKIQNVKILYIGYSGDLFRVSPTVSDYTIRSVCCSRV